MDNSRHRNGVAPGLARVLATVLVAVFLVHGAMAQGERALELETSSSGNSPAAGGDSLSAVTVFALLLIWALEL
ncbi:hypothetical protein BaRGS_00008376 [Batillaria attramentaria]|uniref:Uncharacterized protein n=1 Tax=Batillaria attramentaria TaxID=370345 RepID=A0ABD0LN79_9CAEN